MVLGILLFNPYILDQSFVNGSLEIRYHIVDQASVQRWLNCVEDVFSLYTDHSFQMQYGKTETACLNVAINYSCGY